MFEIETNCKTRRAYRQAHAARGEMMRDLWHMLTGRK